MLTVDRLTQKYRFGNVAFRDVTFSVRRGEIFCVLGETESGKTSLLKTIAGLLPAQAGTITLDQVDITALSPMKRNVRLVFSDEFFENKTVWQNAGYSLSVRKTDRKDRADRIQRYLDMFTLTSKKDCAVKNLTPEERLKLSFVRCFIRDAEVYLLDDPFALIPNRSDVFDKYLPYLRSLQQNAHVIFATSDREEAIRLSSDTLLLRYGVPQQTGRPDDIRRTPQTKYAYTSFYPEYREEEGILATRDGDVILQTNEAEYRLEQKALLHDVFIGKKAVLLQTPDHVCPRLYDATSENLIYFGKTLDRFAR